jgi:hypothetical protein
MMTKLWDALDDWLDTHSRVDSILDVALMGAVLSLCPSVLIIMAVLFGSTL